MDRTGILVIGACATLLLIWYIVYLPRMDTMPAQPPEASPEQLAEQQDEPTPEPPQSSGDTDSDSQPPAAEGLAETGPAPADSSDPQPSATEPAAGQTAPSHPQDTSSLRVIGDGKPVILQANGYMKVRLDPAAGGISNISLLEYQKMTEDGVVEVAGGPVPYLSLVHGDQLLRGETVEVVETSNNHAVFERRYSEPNVKLTESWRLDADRPYLIEYAVNIENTGNTDVHLQKFGITCGTMTQEKTPGIGKAGTAGMVELAVAIKPPDERRPNSYDPKKVGKLSDEQRRELAVSPASWAAVHNKYFVLHCEPAEGSFRGVIPGRFADGDDNGGDDGQLYAVAPLSRRTLSPGDVSDLTFRGYGGPKKLALLKDMGNDLKTLMRLDLFLFFHPRWMEHLTNGILWALVELNDFFNSKWGYGYAIMVITFVIKMLFWPLTHTSTVSMQRMQMLQPQLKELKKQYKDQPQKMQQKTMELYKQNKVNPLGGCLPILLQIPVFFALFNTFRSAIELRQASFLWVSDLSLPDTLPFTPFGFPLRPLALLMGATMLLQQMTTPTSGDPQQKKMMMFMTLFFVFIFYTMPAGLTLYWSVNQILAIIQNMISRRLHKMPNAPPTGTANA